MNSVDSQRRVLSGMRPTGRLHLGHYHGVIKNWLQLQHEYECFLFVADWHALTTNYDEPGSIEEDVWDLVIDWLATGVNPNAATLFIQSRVPEHAELHLLLSMMTPLGWLERVPSYKDMQENLREKRSRYLRFSRLSPVTECRYSHLPGRGSASRSRSGCACGTDP